MATYLLLGLLVATWGWLAVCAWRSHRRFVAQDDVFRCRVRLVSGKTPGLPYLWDRRQWWGRWAHDLLLVRQHGLWGSTLVLPVDTMLGSLARSYAPGGGALGTRPAIVRLQLDNGDVVELAVPESARDVVIGPFFVAGLLGSPGTTHRQPPGR
jgi:hypothetical protein